MVCTLWTVNRIVLYVTADHVWTCFNVSGLAQNSHDSNTIPSLCLAHNSITVCYLTATSHMLNTPISLSSLQHWAKYSSDTRMCWLYSARNRWKYVMNSRYVKGRSSYRAENITYFHQVTGIVQETTNTSHGQNTYVSFSIIWRVCILNARL